MWHFLGEWLWQAINFPVTIAGIVGFFLPLLAEWLIPNVRGWRDKMKPLQKKLLRGFAVFLVLVGLIWAPIHINNEQQKTIISLQNQLEQERNQHKPSLTLVSPLTAKILWDETNEIVMAQINLPIVNQGDNPAYQLCIRCCYASVETASDIHIVTDQTIPNPIFNGQPFSLPFTTVPEHYRSFGNGTPDIVGGALLVYCNLQYSDAPSGGKLCGNEWWLTYGWVTEQLAYAHQADVDKFEPSVREIWSNVTPCQ